MANISKSTPYVRYRENISSSLHLGTIHVESEYLDRTKPTTIESIHGMTWHNRIFNENRELPLLSNESTTLTDKHREYFDTGEKRVPIDVIVANEDCVANEDGTYTYEVRSYESDYLESYDGVNYFKTTSDGLDGEMKITYNTNEEDILGSLIIDDTMSGMNQIENSKDGILERAIINGKTLVNNVLDDSKDTEYTVLGEDINTSEPMVSVDGTIEGEVKGAILKGMTLVNLNTNKQKQVTITSNVDYRTNFLYSIKSGTKITIKMSLNDNSLTKELMLEKKYTDGTSGFQDLTPSIIEGRINITFHEQKDISTANFYLQGSETGSITIKDVVILEGDYTNVDIPYFEGMASVRMPVLKTTGKNLFDYTYWYPLIMHKFDYTITGNKISTIIPSGQWFLETVRANFDKLKEDTIYTISATSVNSQVSILFWKPDGTLIFERGVENTPIAFTTPNEPFVVSMRFCRRLDSDNTVDVQASCENIQIEEGSTATLYEPYKSNILSTPQDLVLGGIGDVQDTLDLLTGEVELATVERGLSTLSNLNWSIFGSGTPNAYYTCVINDAKDGSKIISDSLVSTQIYTTNTEYGVYFSGNSIRLRNDEATSGMSVVDFKNSLSSSTNKIRYVLAEKVVKTVDLSCVDQDGVTQPNKVKTYDTITHFKLSSDTLTPNLNIPSALGYDAIISPSKQYTLRVDRPTSGECSVDVGGTLVTLQDGEQIKTFNTLNTLSHSKVKFTTVGQKVNKVMLLEGNEQGDINYFTGMQSVRMPVLTTIGKNLFDGKFELGTMSSTSGEFTSVTTAIRAKNYIEVKGNTDYVMYIGSDYKMAVVCYDENKQFLRTIGPYVTSHVFHLAKDVKYIKLRTPDGLGLNDVNVEVSLYEYEKGMDVSYHPYKSNILSTPSDLELRGIGDVQDTLDCLTGEVVQNIGEVVLDGSQSISSDSNGVFIRLDDVKRVTNYTNIITCDKLPVLPSYGDLPNVENGISGYVNANGYLGQNWLYVKINNSIDKNEIKQWLSQNPITVQYQLAEPVVKPVDLEILNQNGDNVRNFKTYVGVTNIATSSDGLIPSVQVDYKVASSIETVVGHDIKVENGERADLISCKLYGETLQNILPKPSLKNSMVSKSMQKLNEGYDNINVVDGVAKSAILKGQTLVNLGQPQTGLDNNGYSYQGSSSGITNGNGFIHYAVTNSNTCPFIRLYSNSTKKFFTTQSLKTSTKYMVVVKINVSTTNTLSLIVSPTGYSTANKLGSTSLSQGMQFAKIIFDTPSSFSSNISLGTSTYSTSGDYVDVYWYQLFEYQEGMENWDIPYFEGMQSVKMPVLTISDEDGTKLNTLSTPDDLELRSIGDVGDTLNLLTGEHVRRYGSVTITDEMIDKFSINSNYISNFHIIFDGLEPRNTETFTNKKIPMFSDKMYAKPWINGINVENVVYFSQYGGTLRAYHSPDWTLDEFKQWFRENKPTIIYELAEESIKTVDSSIVNQDGETLEQLHCFRDGYIQLSSEEGSLIPSLDYEVPTNNSYSYYLDLIKTDTQYTVKGSSDCNATIDGNIISLNANGTFTTPSTITDKLMTLDTPVEDLMFIEGDVTDRELPYFEGLASVEEPTIHIHSDNLVGGAVIPQRYSDYAPKSDSVVYAKTKKPFLKLKPNTQYCSLVETEVDAKTQVIFNLFTITGNALVGSNCNNGGVAETRIFSHRAMFTTDGAGELYLGGATFTNEDNFKIWLKHINRAKWLIWEYGTLGSSSTQPYIEALGTKLQPLQPTTLHSIGDIKDEIDYTNNTITKRIGKVVLDGSEDWSVWGGGFLVQGVTPHSDTDIKLLCDKLMVIEYGSIYSGTTYGIGSNYGNVGISIKGVTTLDDLKNYLRTTPITVYYELATPVTEHINLVKPYNKSSVASLTLSSSLSIGDAIRWNPYQEHYARYNVDGTHETLDLTNRQFIELYDRKTLVDQDYNNKIQSQGSTGTTLYCLLEPNTEFDVLARFPELPDGDIKVNLGGTIDTMKITNSIGKALVTTPPTLQNNLCIIYSDGIKATVTDVMVFKHVEQNEELLDLDYCSGVNGIGEVVTVDGVNKAKIIVEQTNGNLIDVPCEVYNNGNNIQYKGIKVKPNTTYILKAGKCERGSNIGCSIEQKDKNGRALSSVVYIGSASNSTGAMFTTDAKASTLIISRQISNKGSAHSYIPIELTLKEMSKENVIRPICHNEFEFILPIQLHRIDAIYDNLYYDELKGYYRIQQSVGHKFFTGAVNENWTLISDGERVMKFRYNNADIQLKQQGEYTTNLLPVTETDNYDSCYFNGTNFTVTITKERLNSETVSGFKEWLSNNNLHLMYQLITPLMHELPQYKGRAELTTYQDEIYSFLKNCLNTEFTLGVATDKAYRWHELEESQGYMNRITSSDERLTKEDALYINHIEGKGIANLIEDTNNVPTLLKPNYSGKATSHQLANSKQSTIKIHGFEPNGGTCGTWNNDTNMYELKVMSGDSSYTNTNSSVLNIPFKLETYEDGTCDRVEYSEENKVWQITGGTTRAIEFNPSSGQFTNQVELFRGMAPRTGLFAEIKVRFISGTTNARMYFSLDGANFGSTILRAMSDDVDYYIGFFNNGGTKIDYAIKYTAESEYTNLVALSPTIPKALIINQIQNINECTQYVDKTYYYDSSVLPLELDTYDGTTNIYMEGKATDTNIIIHNIGLHKQCLTYTDETYTVYWKYLGGEGNITITVGGTTVSVDGKQEYATVKTSLNAPQDALIVGGYNLSVQDLMLVKGAKIDDLVYFEGSRQVGTLYVDEDGNPILDDNGNRQYKISLVSGTELVQDAFEDSITFEDTKKHNVLVTKLLGETLEKLD